MEDGAAAEASVQENIIVDRSRKAGFSRGPRMLWASIGKYARELIARFNILVTSPRTPVGSLSGGNIQKVVVARELSSDPRVIIAGATHARHRRRLGGDGAQPPARRA